MTNTFKIVITATDKATATVRKVKDGIAQFTKPIRQVRQSIGALGKELGIDRMAKGLGRMGAVASDVARRTLGVVTSIAAIAGVSSLAAVAALARQWAFAGAELLRFSAITGAATDRVQTISGAAEMLGLDAASARAGIKSLGDTMEDALYGRNQNALMMMNRLHISLHRTKEGAVDSVRGLLDVADAISRIKNVQAQGVVARTFGVEELLPLLQKGRAGILEYEAQVRRSGAVLSGPALRQAQEFQRSLVFLKLSFQGVANSILSQLVPAIGPGVDGTTKWLQANRGLIATDVKEFIGGITAAIKALTGPLVAIVGDTDNWRLAGIALAVVLAGRLLASIWGLVAPIVSVTAYIVTLAASAIPALILQAALAAEALGASGLAGAFLAVSAALEATPVGWILTALAAIGFAGYELWKHWKDIGSFFDGLWDRISKSFLNGYDRIRPIVRALSYIPGIGAPFALADVAATAIRAHEAANSAAGGGGRAQPKDPAAASKAMKFFQSKGWTKEQAAGLVGNGAWESGLNPGAVGDNGSAYGAFQLHKDRQAAFARWAGHSIRGSSLAEQLAFANYELTKGSEQRAGNALRRQTTVGGATAAIDYGYERPANPAASLAGRLALANGALGGAGGSAAPQRVAVDVHFHGAPAGTKATTKTAKNVQVALKVDYAMPDYSTP